MKQTVLNLFDNGETQIAITKLTNVPRSTVSRWIKSHAKFNDSRRLKAKNASLLSKIESRFIPEPNSGCWIWIGNVKKNGYGSLTVKNQNFYAHRLAYEIFVGPIPKDKVLDHKCRVKCCCNPQHLEAVTQAENCKRGNRWKEKGKR